MDKIFYPHCLSRGFVDDVELKEQGDLVRPEAIDKLMEISDYNSFNLGLENTAHLAIPRSIRGDFSLLTAPSGM
jgi:tyrosinase